MKALLIRSTVLVLLFAPAAIVGQSASTTVTRVEFARTRTIKSTGQQITTETGTYLIRPDGTYRIDRVRNGIATAQIERYKERKRILLNLKTREATVTSPRSLAAPPSSQTPTPGLPGPAVQSRDLADLGTRFVNGLTLNGHRSTVIFDQAGKAIVHTIDLWEYRDPDPRKIPIVLETRFETPDEIDQTQVTAVTEDLVDNALFDVPAGFRTVNQ